MDPGDIAIVDHALQELIKEWDKFFGSVRKTAPTVERERLARRLRLLADDPSGRVADQFRIDQIQNRFMSYSQMWDRLLREREEGRKRQAAAYALDRAAAAAAAESAATAPNAQQAAAVDDGGVEDLFQRFLAAKRELGQPTRVDRAAFAGQLEEQRRQLESRLGYRVRFEVVVDVNGSKVKLAARRAAGGQQE
jgi:hypothetical protein